jgi:hypothetical protein
MKTVGALVALSFISALFASVRTYGSPSWTVLAFLAGAFFIAGFFWLLAIVNGPGGPTSDERYSADAHKEHP